MTNKTMWILATLWMTFLAILMLTGCRTKTVTEYVAVHDTTYSAIRDTVTKTVTNTVTRTDSAAGFHYHGLTEKLFETRDRTITLNDRGDTTRVDTHTATLHYLHEKDSIGYYRERCDSLATVADTYKSKCDSLQSVIDHEREKTTVKGETWWERWRWKLAALAALCAVLCALWRSSKENIKKWLKR